MRILKITAGLTIKDYSGGLNIDRARDTRFIFSERTEHSGLYLCDAAILDYKWGLTEAIQCPASRF